MTTPCIACPIPDVPQIPDIFVSITIPPLPGLSGDFCCSFSLTDPGLVAAAQLVVNVALALPGAAVNQAIDMVNGEVMAVAMPIILKLKMLRVSCPLDGTVTL